MKKYRRLFILLTGIFLTNISNGQDNQIVPDYFSVPGPIRFDSITYNLAWSSHPIYTYYLQEYLAEGDSLQKFHKMLLLNLQIGDMSVDDIVSQKIAELDKIKATNPVVQHSLFESPKKKDEAVLDFFISENTPTGLVSTFEWNIYHYKKMTDKSGHKGILLFGISMRSYGNDIDTLFKTLTDYRKNHMLPTFIDYPIPTISILSNAK